MKIYLKGKTGGIGGAIEKLLEGQEFTCNLEDADWLIFAHGIIDEEDPQRTFDVNTVLCIEETKEALSTMKGVIYISSTASITANSLFPVYSASKAALNTFTVAMAKSYPSLEFYALCPGPTNTKMWSSLDLDGTAQEPEEVAKGVKEIMDGKYKSGSIITVRNGIIKIQ